MCIFILMDRYLEKVKKEVEKQLDNDVFFVNNEEEIANNLNKILLKTISIQKEEISSNSQYYVQVGDNFISKKKPIFFSIFIAVISSFYKEKYLEGIKKLSIVAGFLQNNSSFQKVKNHDMIQNGLEDFVVTFHMFRPEDAFLIAEEKIKKYTQRTQRNAEEKRSVRSNEKVTSGIVAINAWKAHFKKFR